MNYDSAVVTIRTIRTVVYASILFGAAQLAACSHADTAPPVATVAFHASRSRVPLGSPVDLSYRFTVAPGASIDGDYLVFMHVISADGQTLWDDDHEPPTPTSQWKPGQTIEYTRTRFVPVVPYLGEATVRVGLYRKKTRLPLQGADPADRQTMAREYKVGTIELLPSSDNVFISYTTGWFPDEADPNDSTTSWRWTGPSAGWSIANPHGDITLDVEYAARPDLFPAGPQQVTILAGDQPVASFTADSKVAVLKRLPITAAQLGSADTVEFHLNVDKTFVPKVSDPPSVDTRELGIRVYHLFVEGR
jgi:hypothetical protein